MLFQVLSIEWYLDKLRQRNKDRRKSQRILPYLKNFFKFSKDNWLQRDSNPQPLSS